MLSLFVLSLPRSLSTEVHRIGCDALGLAAPLWTTAGEILNLDRFAMNAGRFSASPKYIQRRHGAIFDAAVQFLDQAYLRDGFCYKDVTQPFVIGSWVRQNPNVRVLKIMPNIPHVAFAMMQRKWMYPTVASRQIGDEATMMIEGLLMAEGVLREVPGEEIGFDVLLQGTEALEAMLERHAEGAPLAPFGLPEDFERRRDAVLARRSLDAFKRLEDLEYEIRTQMARRVDAFVARKGLSRPESVSAAKAVSGPMLRPAMRQADAPLQVR